MPKFPTLDLNDRTSPEIYSPNRTRDVPNALGQVGAAADAFGRRLQEMAESAAGSEGQARGAQDAAAGAIQPRNNGTAFGDAYDQVAKDALHNQRRASMAELMGKAFVDNPDNPIELEKAFGAIRQGFGRTGYGDLDTALDGEFSLRRASFMTASAENVRTRLVEQGRANFMEAQTNGQALLDQAASSATFDGGGGRRVAEAYAGYVRDLAKYGPKGAFSVGGIQFDADPTRSAALGVDDIAKAATAAQVKARETWMLAAADRLPTAEAKRKFVADLQARWRGESNPDQNFARNSKHAVAQASYQTALPPAEEQQFRQWVQQNAIPFDPNDAKSDYDMRGYWRDVASKGGDETAMNADDHRRHFPDTYKTPYHRSFSAESRFAREGAPAWADDHQLVDPATKEVVFDERGDPAFAGMDADAIDRVSRLIEGDAGRMETDARTHQALAGQEARNLIEAYRYGDAGVSPDEMIAAAKASGDTGLMAQARFFANADISTPGVLNETVARQMGLVGPFRAAAEFLIDDIEGNGYVENDNGRPSKMGMRATSADGTRNGKPISEWSRAEVLAEYKTTYWDAIGANELPPPLALMAFDAAVNHGPAKAKAWIAESGGDVGKYAALRQAEYERLARENPAKYADDLPGWQARLRKVMGAAAAIEGGSGAGEAFKALDAPQLPANLAEGYRSDPIGYARGGKNRPPLATVPALDMAALASKDPQARAAWGDALRQRLALGRTLSARDQVPARILDNGEREFLKSELATNPAMGVELATAARGAAGVEGAQTLLRELGADGGEAALALHLGGLAMLDRTPFVDAAVRGLQLRAQGVKMEPYKAAEDNFDEAAAKLAPAFRYAPDVLASARSVGELARMADAAAGVKRSASYYLSSALGGAHNGRQGFGGVVVRHGAPAALPPWLATDHIDEALRVLGDAAAGQPTAPAFANGQPMKGKDIAGMQLHLRPNGRYWLSSPRTGQLVRSKMGAIFELDLEAARGDLARRGWVRGGR